MAAIYPDNETLGVPLIEDVDKEGIESNIEDVGNTSVFRTCFNLLNALSGVGILSTPYALASGGWLSLILLFAIATAAWYSGLLIQKCMDADSTIRSYPDMGERAFGNKGRLIVSNIMYIELYLVATGFLILEGDNLQNLLPSVDFDIGTLSISGKQGFIVIVALIILPTVWLDNLSLLSYVSASGVMASAVILGSIVWTGAFSEIGFRQKGSLIRWEGIPTAVSLYSFCYCAHPVFPTLYTSMKKRHQFSNVLIVCFLLCTICYASMAIFGYLMFGTDVESQITLNLPTNKLSSRVAIYTTLVNPIAKYAIMVTPILNVTKTWFPCHYSRRFVSLFTGTTLVLSTMILALSVPFFGSLMSLVGAFLSISASVILPCSCYMKISGIYRRFGTEFVAISLMILMGVTIVVFGTYTSVVDIFGKL